MYMAVIFYLIQYIGMSELDDFINYYVKIER